jgi:hypothetical protein
METVLINAEKKSDIAFILSLAKKLGMNAKSLSKSETEDWELANKIKVGMKSQNVSRNEIMKALGK